jgi:hypothetical protein
VTKIVINLASETPQSKAPSPCERQHSTAELHRYTQAHLDDKHVVWADAVLQLPQRLPRTRAAEQGSNHATSH